MKDEVEEDACEGCGKAGPTIEAEGAYLCKQCAADKKGDR